ncbi:membrane transport protein [Rhodococcus erythropolis]|nr:membrane transport protein [Rhodococcus erythropolis]
MLSWLNCINPLKHRSRVHLVTSAIVPIVIMLALGTVLRRRFVTDPSFWRSMEWLNYHVLTPALFISSIAVTEVRAMPVGPMLLTLAAPLVLTVLMLVALRRMLKSDGPRLTSVVQGSIRINTYIGLGFASALHGSEGIATFALCSAIVVPTVNVLCITVLVFYGASEKTVTVGSVARELATNPLILACLIGLVLSVTGVSLPDFAGAALSLLSSPALVTGTLTVGAGLTLRLSLRDAADVGLSSALRLVALPLFVGSLAAATGIHGVLLTSVLLISAVPTAPSAYILASRLGGDTRLMASITGIQTLLSTVTMPLMLYL